MNRLSVVSKFATLGERQVRVVASDTSLDRMGDRVIASGCVVNGPVPVLFSHNPDIIVGNGQITVKSDSVEALITFAPAGVSAKADEICALCKAGFVNGVSVGFNPLESEPLANGGRKYTKWELYEISLVAVPANVNARVVERTLRSICKSGRVLSDENMQHVVALHDCFTKAARCHLEAMDLHDAYGEQLDALRGHLKEVARHAKALLRAGALKPSSDETASDQELAAHIVRLKDLAVLTAKGDEQDRELERIKRQNEHWEMARRAQFPKVPKLFKTVDTARQVRAVILAGQDIHGVNVHPLDLDFSEYLSTRAVCWQHGEPIGWCVDIKAFASHVEACCQFPPLHVSEAADRVYDLIASGKVTGASVAFSYYRSPDGPKDAYLKEWSFCYDPADKGARVLSVGGQAVRRRWDAPGALRVPSLEEIGGGPAHWAAAHRRYHDLWQSSRYYRG